MRTQNCLNCWISIDGTYVGIMLGKVLYFPYIRVPDNEWFTRVLLYWDQVGSIIPEELAQNPERLGSYMKELIELKMVIPVIPGPYIGGIPNFRKAFLDMIDRNPTISDRKFVALARGETLHIHMEKLFPLSDPLIERGLAKETRYPWFDVERHTAYQFMAYLSSVLGKLDALQMIPITDYDDYLSEYQSFSAFHPTAARVSRLQTTLLKDVLPVPARGISIQEIYDFKTEHSELLSAFRRHIERTVIELAETDDDYLRHRKLLLKQDELTHDINRISDEMKKKNWGNIIKTTLKGLSVSTSLGELITTAINPGALLTKIPDLLVAVYDAFTGSPFHQKKIREEPLAYAAFARQKLARG